LHMNNGEAHCLMGWQHRPSPKWLGWVRPNSKKNPFWKIVIVFLVFFTKFRLVFGWYFYTEKNTNPVFKFLVFVKTSKIQKNLKNRKKKMFLCIQPSVSKLKIIFCFSYTKKTMF
jgi:hypothetical protein